MARRLRIQFPGARYHGINRGNCAWASRAPSVPTCTPRIQGWQAATSNSRTDPIVLIRADWETYREQSEFEEVLGVIRWTQQRPTSGRFVVGHQLAALGDRAAGHDHLVSHRRKRAGEREWVAEAVVRWLFSAAGGGIHPTSISGGWANDRDSAIAPHVADVNHGLLASVLRNFPTASAGRSRRRASKLTHSIASRIRL